MKIKFGQDVGDVGTLVVTDVSDINNKDIDFKKQIFS